MPIRFFEGENRDLNDRLIFALQNATPEEMQAEFEKAHLKKTSEEDHPSSKITFDYGYEISNVKSIEQLREVIEEHFPTIWFETKACASLYGAMSLKNLNGCPSLNLVGKPSGEKTTTISFFYNHNISYISDDFTPRAFVSHSANVKEYKLAQVDLLPKIKDKVLVTPELAPLFEANKEKLLDNFSILTRVLDGEGLNRDSGVHGHRGYSGDYKFGWVGGTTPLKAHVWNIMGKMGNRLFFLNMRDKNRSDQDYVDMFRGKAYENKVKICRGAVKSFLDEHFKRFPIRSLEWDAEQDILLLTDIVKYAQLLSKLRGTLMIWRGEGEDYQYSFPVTEEPPRAINNLYNLAKGHALIHGRTYLKSEDLELVRAIAFSSMPHDRFEFLKLLLKHEGRLTTQNIQTELNCSDETARKTMKTFEILGIVSIKSLTIDTSIGGRPMSYVEIKPEFLPILKATQVLDYLEKSIPSKNEGMYEHFSVNDFVKSVNNKENLERTPPMLELEKSIPSQINHMCETCNEPNASFYDGYNWYCKQCVYNDQKSKGYKK